MWDERQEIMLAFLNKCLLCLFSGNRLGCSNIAYPKLVLELLPAGLKGVMLSVMLAALMSDLTSIFNSASTLFTMDVYKHLRKSATVRELMVVGRAFVVFMVVIGVIWIPVIEGMQGGQMYIYIQAISAYLAPPIAAVYLIAVLWKRANEQGAFWGLMSGMVVGVIRMILDFAYPEPGCEDVDTRPAIVAKFHYMYFAMMLFWVTGIVMIIVSLLTKPLDDDHLIRVTYWTRKDRTIRKDEIYDKTSAGGHPVDNESLPMTNMQSKDGAVGGVVASDEKSPASKGAEVTAAEHIDDTKVILINVAEPKQEEATQSKRFTTHIRRAYDWFCGFDDTERGEISRQYQQEHLKKITSLKQDGRAKLFLNLNLAFIVSLAAFLYAFFSTKHFGLLD